MLNEELRIYGGYMTLLFKIKLTSQYQMPSFNQSIN